MECLRLHSLLKEFTKAGRKTSRLERNFLEKYLSRSSFLVKLQAFSHDFQENQFNEQLEMNAPEEKV